jgi:inner membrane protein
MDNLTHALLGLTVHNSLPEKSRTTLWVSLLASELPDVDILYTFSGSSAEYLLNHRGFSHSIAAALIMAGLISLVSKKLSPGEKTGRIFLLALGCLGLHILFDIFTSWGTQFLQPFSQRWFYLDWLPIIDIVIIAVAVFFLAVGKLGILHARKAAGLAILLIGIYVFSRADWHHKLVNSLHGFYPGADKAAAIPQIYPWCWKGIVEMKDSLISGNISRSGHLDEIIQIKINAADNRQYLDKYGDNLQFEKTVQFFRYPLYKIEGDKLVINDFYYSFREVIFPLDSERQIAGRASTSGRHR